MTAATSLSERMEASHPSLSSVGRTIWQDFVARAVDLLDLTEQRLRDDAVWTDFSKREGWWLKAKRRAGKGRTVRMPSEDAITHAIEETAKKILRENKPADPLNDQLVLDAQVIRPPHHRIGSSAYTTDIRIRSCHNDELEIRLEAKLLFIAGDVAAHYAGAKGLLRFADPRAPYTDKPIGCMLGYRMRDDEREWRDRIHSKLSSMPEALNVGLVAIKGREILASELEWGSGEAQRVTVLHLGMDYETDPSCRP